MWDDTFDISSIPAQLHYFQACNDLKTTHINMVLANNPTNVKCPLQDLYFWATHPAVMATRPWIGASYNENYKMIIFSLTNQTHQSLMFNQMIKEWIFDTNPVTSALSFGKSLTLQQLIYFC